MLRSLGEPETAASVTGKLAVASGAGGAAYASVNGESLIAFASLIFTALAFFVNWYYERRKTQLQEQNAEREHLLAQQRLEMEAFDRAEQRRIMEAAWAKAEKRDAAAITQMQQLGGIPSFRDTGMQQLDMK